ncbi:hypothetical protein [Paraburkholderia sp. J10-1]|uniref:hypothetical protein n=1 Tax=Paraburkholderia sp. J10-1 TaxID=2805430 RepID=UPI002AB797CB|nr:hypothetical protein [Paraburkholderia sp. J10-1]
MAEPVTSSFGAAVVGLLSGALGAMATSAVHLPSNTGLLFGVVGGSAMFLARPREGSRFQKAISFGVSLSGGYHLSLWVLEAHPGFSAWATGFFSSLLIVAVAVKVLDWVEKNVQPLLDKLSTWVFDKWFGGGGGKSDE